jgi:hypothetical protein
MRPLVQRGIAQRFKVPWPHTLSGRHHQRVAVGDRPAAQRVAHHDVGKVQAQSLAATHRRSDHVVFDSCPAFSAGPSSSPRRDTRRHPAYTESPLKTWGIGDLGSKTSKTT